MGPDTGPSWLVLVSTRVEVESWMKRGGAKKAVCATSTGLGGARKLVGKRSIEGRICSGLLLPVGELGEHNRSYSPTKEAFGGGKGNGSRQKKKGGTIEPSRGKTILAQRNENEAY